MSDFVPIRGFDDLYEIASDGRIRSVPRTVLRRNGVSQKVRGMAISVQVNKRGLKTVRLVRGPRLGTTCLQVASLVAKHFVENPGNFANIEFLDGDVLNVEASNLFWTTRARSRRKAPDIRKCAFCDALFTQKWHAQKFCCEEHGFKNRVQKTTDATSCWLWGGAIMKNGYGVFAAKRKDASGRSFTKNVLAHRMSFEAHVGPVPQDMFVLHRCDTPACVRPHHLFLGTQTDNMRDCSVKGRVRHQDHRGEANNKARLTEDDVRAIRVDDRQAGRIALQYGITVNHVHQVRTRRCWKHID